MTSTHIVDEIGIARFCSKLAGVDRTYTRGTWENKCLIHSGLCKTTVIFKIIGIHLEYVRLHDHLHRKRVHAWTQSSSRIDLLLRSNVNHDTSRSFSTALFVLLQNLFHFFLSDVLDIRSRWPGCGHAANLMIGLHNSVRAIQAREASCNECRNWWTGNQWNKDNPGKQSFYWHDYNARRVPFLCFFAPTYSNRLGDSRRSRQMKYIRLNARRKVPFYFKKTTIGIVEIVTIVSSSSSHSSRKREDENKKINNEKHFGNLNKCLSYQYFVLFRKLPSCPLRHPAQHSQSLRVFDIRLLFHREKKKPNDSSGAGYPKDPPTISSSTFLLLSTIRFGPLFFTNNNE